MITASEMHRVAKESRDVCYADLNMFQKLRVIYESGRMTKKIEKRAAEGKFSAWLWYDFVGLSKNVQKVLKQVFKEKGFETDVGYCVFMTSWDDPEDAKCLCPPTGGSSMQDE